MKRRKKRERFTVSLDEAVERLLTPPQHVLDEVKASKRERAAHPIRMFKRRMKNKKKAAKRRKKTRQ